MGLEDVLGRPRNVQPNSKSFPKQQRKKPKARPPNNLRDHIPLLSKLPYYSGPYKVGIIDMEVPAKNPRTFSDIKENGVHVLKLETILMTIYYPAHIDSGIGDPPNGSKKWRRPNWLLRPRDKIAKGYGKFAGLPETPTMAFFLATCGLTKLPAYRNLRIADHWPPSRRGREHAFEIKNSKGEPPPGSTQPPQFPLIIFSHGLGGSRTCYSSVCGEFASYGFVVVAVEHRDGSGARTIVNHPPEGLGSREERERRGSLAHNAETAKKHAYDTVDFIFPKSDPHDTAPGHKTDRELRGAQIDMRLAEMGEAFNLMLEIEAGRGQVVAENNIRFKSAVGGVGGSSEGLRGIKWDEWKGRFHTTSCTAIGHSFGAATVIEAIRHTDKFQNLTQGIIYDLWGMAVKPPDDKPHHRIRVPMLSINSEAFMYWPENFAVAQMLCEEVRERGNPCWMMTVRGTVHISQSDFCILYPRLASMLLKAAMDPVQAIDLNIDASLEFLSRVLPLENVPFKRVLADKKLLDLTVLEEMPTEHRPNAKHKAVRLKFEHEARTRLTGGMTKQYLERIRKAGEEEVWLHVRPTDDEIALFEEQAEGRGRYVPPKLEEAQSLNDPDNDDEDVDSDCEIDEEEKRENVERIRSIRERDRSQGPRVRKYQTPAEIASGAHGDVLRHEAIQTHVDHAFETGQLDDDVIFPNRIKNS